MGKMSRVGFMIALVLSICFVPAVQAAQVVEGYKTIQNQAEQRYNNQIEPQYIPPPAILTVLRIVATYVIKAVTKLSFKYNYEIK